MVEKRRLIQLGVVVLGGLLAGVFVVSSAPAKGKKVHPFDLYNHEMHTPLFESASVACETCHADPESYGNRKKVNRLGCHLCHKDRNGPLQATNDCKMCHIDGFPKPASHKVDWIKKHQVYAKQEPATCEECHSNQKFCINCHSRRDTVQEEMHRRNFRYFHSIEARANPRRCEVCHAVNFCQECHAVRGTSKR